MADEDFYSAVEVAKQIERKMLQYAPYEGKIEVSLTLDFYPKEYIDVDYQELLNRYDHLGKVIKTSKMNIYGAAGPTKPEIAKSITSFESPKSVQPAEIKPAAKPVAIEEPRPRTDEIEEIEAKVKEITETSLSNAEQVKSAQSIEKIEEKLKFEHIEEKEKAADISGLDLSALEFEKPVEKRIERPVQQPTIPEPSAPSAPAIAFEKKEKEIIAPAEERIEAPKVPVPQVLAVSAEPVATEKYEDMEEHFKREWGGEISEQNIKKKMLELTKSLFKEKSINARDKMKREIITLKTMLSKMAGKTKKAAATEVASGYSPTFFDSLTGTQSSELNTAKDMVVSTLEREIDATKRRFYDKMAGIPEEKMNEKRAVYEKFVFELTSLSERLIGILSQQQNFIAQKHGNEIAQFIAGLPKEETKLADTAKGRLDSIKTEYENEFTGIRMIITKKIEALIDNAGRQIFKEEPKEAAAENTSRVLFEINETDEATLLYYLHSKSPDVYKKYERKHLSKHEAVHYAKILMAKEKGLSDDIITKYFGQFTPKGEK